MATMAQRPAKITVGVDTHGDVHVAAALDDLGRLLDTISVPSTAAGHGRLLRWARASGEIGTIGVEGTGAYGAGLARYLRGHGIRVVEVDRPDRRTRRAKGKSDPIDAEAAARAVLSGAARGEPKSRDGAVEMIRTLRVCRRSASQARTQTINQMHSLVTTAPEELRTVLRDLTPRDLMAKVASFRMGGAWNPTSATKLALRELAHRYRFLTEQLRRLDGELKPLVAMAAPRLVAINGVGTQIAGQLLVTAGDNPERLRSESAFAHLCGVAPVPASSGKTIRHRLSRAGDRAANYALWRVVMVRLTSDDRTKAYMARRRSEGLSKREVIRCLKRYVAREVYRGLVDER
jgi:transposase